jgi:hypothetical protein
VLLKQGKKQHTQTHRHIHIHTHRIWSFLEGTEHKEKPTSGKSNDKIPSNLWNQVETSVSLIESKFVPTNLSTLLPSSTNAFHNSQAAGATNQNKEQKSAVDQLDILLNDEKLIQMANLQQKQQQQGQTQTITLKTTPPDVKTIPPQLILQTQTQTQTQAQQLLQPNKATSPVPHLSLLSSIDTNARKLTNVGAVGSPSISPTNSPTNSPTGSDAEPVLECPICNLRFALLFYFSFILFYVILRCLTFFLYINLFYFIYFILCTLSYFIFFKLFIVFICLPYLFLFPFFVSDFE